MCPVKPHLTEPCLDFHSDNVHISTSRFDVIHFADNKHLQNVKVNRGKLTAVATLLMNKMYNVRFPSFASQHYRSTQFIVVLPTVNHGGTARS